MEDIYLSEDAQYERLLSDYKKNKRLIVACDFDDTIHDFHKKGRTYPKVINLLKRCRAANFYIVIFTANFNTRLIKDYCADNGIEFDGINENVIDTIDLGFPEARKIFFNILLDDRAGLGQAYNLLNKLLNEEVN